MPGSDYMNSAWFWQDFVTADKCLAPGPNMKIWSWIQTYEQCLTLAIWIPSQRQQWQGKTGWDYLWKGLNLFYEPCWVFPRSRNLLDCQSCRKFLYLIQWLKKEPYRLKPGLHRRQLVTTNVQHVPRFIQMMCSVISGSIWHTHHALHSGVEQNSWSEGIWVTWSQSAFKWTLQSNSTLNQ